MHCPATSCQPPLHASHLPGPAVVHIRQFVAQAAQLLVPSFFGAKSVDTQFVQEVGVHTAHAVPHPGVPLGTVVAPVPATVVRPVTAVPNVVAPVTAVVAAVTIVVAVDNNVVSGVVNLVVTVLAMVELAGHCIVVASNVNPVKHGESHLPGLFTSHLRQFGPHGKHFPVAVSNPLNAVQKAPGLHLGGAALQNVQLGSQAVQAPPTRAKPLMQLVQVPATTGHVAQFGAVHFSQVLVGAGINRKPLLHVSHLPGPAVVQPLQSGAHGLHCPVAGSTVKLVAWHFVQAVVTVQVWHPGSTSPQVAHLPVATIFPARGSH